VITAEELISESSTPRPESMSGSLTANARPGLKGLNNSKRKMHGSERSWKTGSDIVDYEDLDESMQEYIDGLKHGYSSIEYELKDALEEAKDEDDFKI